jgi:uncharacterized protein
MNSKIKFSVGHETLVGQRVTLDPETLPKILFIHGAGQSTKERALPLALEILKRGLSSFLFDFSGHGESSGQLKQSSLAKRLLEARAALRFCDKSTPLGLCGFSMGAHIALDLLPSTLVKTLILFYPAIYTRKASTVPFSEGFSEIIRQPRSWEDSEAIDTLGSFTGRLLVVRGEKDEVIPEGVFNLLDTTASRTSRKKFITVPEAGHLLLDRVYSDPVLFDQLVDQMIDFLT